MIDQLSKVASIGEAISDTQTCGEYYKLTCVKEFVH